MLTLKTPPVSDAGRWNPEEINFHILDEVTRLLMFTVVSRLTMR